MPPPVLYYIRHGETDWNVEGRLQGQHDIPINASGYWPALTAALNTPSLATNPPVSGTPACASRNSVRRPARIGSRVESPR